MAKRTRTDNGGSSAKDFSATIGFEGKLWLAAGVSAFRSPHSEFLSVLANPPFNDSDPALRGSAFLQTGGTLQVMAERQDNFRKDDDVRWQFGVPPKGNANFAWVQHFIHHLAPATTGTAGGMAGFVLANGSMEELSNSF